MNSFDEGYSVLTSRLQRVPSKLSKINTRKCNQNVILLCICFEIRFLKNNHERKNQLRYQIVIQFSHRRRKLRIRVIDNTPIYRKINSTVQYHKLSNRRETKIKREPWFSNILYPFLQPCTLNQRRKLHHCRIDSSAYSRTTYTQWISMRIKIRRPKLI